MNARARAVVVGAVLLLGAAWWWSREESPTASASPQLESEKNQPAVAPGSTVDQKPVIAIAPPPLLPAVAMRDVIPECMSQPDAPQRRVAGRVTFEGQPVPDAVVRLEPQQSPAGLRVKSVRTDADGHFDFGAQPALTFSVGAGAPARTAVVTELDLRDPTRVPASDALELVLLPCDARLMGKVLDSGGGGIPHARVRLIGTEGAETNATGAYELCLSLGRAMLRVSADGYGATVANVLVLGRTTQNFVLAPESFIVGRVVDETGAAVPDALVVARSHSADGAFAAESTFSDAGGRFQLSVTPGEYRLFARSATGSTSSVTTATALVGRVSDEVVLKLQTKGRLKGRVVSAGQPVAGAKVEALGTASARGSEAVSQADGTFVMTHVPEGELKFLASPWEVVAPKTFTMTKRTATVELEVKPLALLRGVVTRSGKPVAGAQVVAQSAMQRPETVSDAKGHYVLRGLSAGPWSVYATSERVGAFVEAKVTLAAREEKQLDLELSSAATVAGRVVDETGQPVPGAYVVYSLPRTGDEGRSITDVDGHFECNLMTGGGEYQPVVYTSPTSSTPYKAVRPPLPAAKLDDGSSRVEGVTLAIKWERIPISGKVLDVSGAPVPDARVRASSQEYGAPNFSPWMKLPVALTDASGAFTLEGLTSGNWALQARTPDGAEATVSDIAAGAKNVVITVRPPGGIEGTLRGYRTPPVVYAKGVGQERFQPAQVDGETFRVQLAPGTYIVTAMNLQEGAAQRVDVREGAMTKVTLTSRGQGTIHGTVLDRATRAPIAGLICHTVVRAGNDPGITNWDENLAPKTGADGKFVVDPAPAGEVAVSCFGEAALSSASTLTVVPQGGKVDVTLEAVRRGNDTPGEVGLSFEATPQVTRVNPQGAGAKAGVLVGDVVTAVDGAPVAGLDGDGVSTLISNHPPGTQLTLDVTRATQQRRFTLVTTAAE